MKKKLNTLSLSGPMVEPMLGSGIVVILLSGDRAKSRKHFCLRDFFCENQSILAKITLSKPISESVSPSDLVNWIMALAAPIGAASVMPVYTCH